MGRLNLISTQVPTCLWVTVAAALNWSIYFRLGDAASSLLRSWREMAVGTRAASMVYLFLAL